jgi:hypothetical protein
LARPAPLALQVPLALPAPPDRKVLKVLLAPPVLLAHRAQTDSQVRAALPESDMTATPSR